MPPGHITIKDIARSVGVHHATVSRAVRNDPRIVSATTSRIKAAAIELGFQPDTHMHALSAFRAGLRAQNFRDTHGFIWPENTPEEVAQQPYVSRTITAARTLTN